MGLPRDVSSGATVVGFTAAHPLSADHSHHTLPYANHAPRCESGRSQRTMGSLAGFPWLGEYSSISITLLLLSQETAGGVMSPYTHHIGFPYNICVFHTRASNRQSPTCKCASSSGLGVANVTPMGVSANIMPVAVPEETWIVRASTSRQMTRPHLLHAPRPTCHSMRSRA